MPFLGVSSLDFGPPSGRSFFVRSACASAASIPTMRIEHVGEPDARLPCKKASLGLSRAVPVAGRIHSAVGTLRQGADVRFVPTLTGPIDA